MGCLQCKKSQYDTEGQRDEDAVQKNTITVQELSVQQVKLDEKQNRNAKLSRSHSSSGRSHRRGDSFSEADKNKHHKANDQSSSSEDTQGRSNGPDANDEENVTDHEVHVHKESHVQMHNENIETSDSPCKSDHHEQKPSDSNNHRKSNLSSPDKNKQNHKRSNSFSFFRKDKQRPNSLHSSRRKRRSKSFSTPKNKKQRISNSISQNDAFEQIQFTDIQTLAEEPDVLDSFPDPIQITILDFIPRKKVNYINIEDTFWSKKKALIPDYSVMESIDSHALKAPESLSTSPEKLVNYLIKPCKTEVEKLRAVIRWIGDNIAYDVDGRNDTSRADCTVEGVLRNKKAVCEGYANVVQMFAQLVGIEIEKISGQTKNGENPKANLRTIPKSDHAWNRVKIGGTWYFVDSTWCAGSVGNEVFNKQWDEWWFLPDPEAFVLTHLPMESNNSLSHNKQMVHQPHLISVEWDKQVERTPGAVTFGIEAVSHPETRITTNKNTMTIEYRCKEKLSHYVTIYFEQNNVMEQVHDSWYVMYELDDMVHCQIRFEKAGVYIARFGAKIKHGHNLIKNVPMRSLLYRITFKGKGTTSYPEALHYWLGLHADFDESGFQLIDPKKPVISTATGRTTITVKLPTSGIVSNGVSFYKSDRRNPRQSKKLDDLVYSEKRGDIARYYIQCPEIGDYKLGIFSKYIQGESLNLAMTFLVSCTSVNVPLYHHPSKASFCTQLAGPNAHFYEVGLTTDQNSSTIHFVDNTAVLCIRKTKPASVLVKLQSVCQVNSEELLKQSDTKEQMKITVHQPNLAGYYWLSIYAKEGLGSGSVPYAGCFCIPYKVPSHE